MARSFVNFDRRPDARIKIFCLPHAGGPATSYRRWAKHVHSAIEIWSAALPGRGERANERPVTHFPELVDELELAVRSHADRPYALFGHSLGGLVAYDLAARLTSGSASKPAHLFISAAPPPDWPRPNTRLHRLPDAQIVQYLRQLGGLPPALADNREALSAVMPALRADLELADSYRCLGAPPPLCNVTVLGGLTDPLIERSSLAAWRRFVRSGFTLRMYPGDHFYLVDQTQALLSLMERTLLKTV